MDKQSSNIAILFFSRSAQAEARNKRFLRNHEISPNSKVASSLINHTLGQIQKTDLPYYHIDERQQVGKSFGERFANAFKHLFEKGYDYVISVGNDIPQLKAQHILKAAAQLRSGNAKTVLGPDTDGGTWLMGYSRDTFMENKFRQLPWNTGYLLESILKQTGSNSPYLLEILADIDDPREFISFLKRELRNTHLYQLIRQIRSIISGTVKYITAKPPTRSSVISYPTIRLRAPPIR